MLREEDEEDKAGNVADIRERPIKNLSFELVYARVAREPLSIPVLIRVVLKNIVVYVQPGLVCASLAIQIACDNHVEGK